MSSFERLRFDLIEVFQNLKFLSGVQETNLKSLNVVDLTSECLNISQQLVLNSGKIGMPHTFNFDELESLTEAEKLALKAQSESSKVNENTEQAFKAVCSQAQLEYRRERTQTESDFEIVEQVGKQ